MIVSYPVRRRGPTGPPRGYGSIGEAVAAFLSERPDVAGEARVVAVVPRMLSFFATGPERYEVVEVDVLLYEPDEPSAEEEVL